MEFRKCSGYIVNKCNTYALPILRLLFLRDLGLLHLLRLPQLILRRLIQVAWFDLDELQRIVGRLGGCRLCHSLLLHVLGGIKGGRQRRQLKDTSADLNQSPTT